MSKSIDEQIVKMTFDNKNFESGVKTTINSLSSLKKSVESVEKNDGSVSFDKTIDSLVKKSTSLGTTIRRVINEDIVGELKKAASKIGGYVKELSVDQISAGWDKYAQKTTAVQSIINNAKKASGEAYSMEEVNAQLEKLMWFTDETSYNFTDMVSNIGKFVSNGVELETSVTAMEGIALWAASAGQGANEASRAMYNLSQALSIGSVKSIDWKSIQNANMATREFKQTVLDTGVEMGLLKKQTDGTYKTVSKAYAEMDRVMGTVTVSATAFESSLSDGWFTSELLLETLNKYGGYSDYLNEYISQVEEATGKTLTAAEAMEILGSNGMDLGMKAFKMGQEAKTFKEAIVATQDAVSSGWASVFEIIFGNYEEAKVLWTNLANYLYDVFTAPTWALRELLGVWSLLGGKDSFISALKKLGPILGNVSSKFKSVWEEVFEPITSDKLVSISQNFNILTDKINKLTGENKTWAKIIYNQLLPGAENFEDVVSGLHDTLKGVFSVFKIIGNAISAVFRIGKLVFKDIGKFLAALAPASGFIGNFITGLSDAIEESDFFYNALKKVYDWFHPILEYLTKFIQNTVNPAIKELTEELGPLKEVCENVAQFLSGKFAEGLELVKDGIDKLFGKLVPYISDVSFVQKILEKLGITLDDVPLWIKTITLVLSPIGGIIYGVVTAVNWLIDVGKQAYDVIKSKILPICFEFDDELGKFVFSFDKLKETGTLAWDALKNGVKNAIAKVGPKLAEVRDEFKDAFSPSGIKNAWDDILVSLKKIADGAVDLIKVFLELFDDIAFAVLDAIDVLIDGMLSRLPKIEQWVGQVLTSFKNVIQKNIDTITDIAVMIVTAICDTILRLEDKIVDTALSFMITVFDRVAQSIPSIENNYKDDMITFLDSLYDMVIGGFEESKWGQALKTITAFLFPNGIESLADIIDTGVFVSFVKTIKNILDTLNGILGTFNNNAKWEGNVLATFSGFLTGIGDSLKTFADNYNKADIGDIILKAAISVALLAGSIALLALIPQDNIETAILTVGSLLVVVSFLLEICSKLANQANDNTAKSLNGIAKLATSLGVALLLIVATLILIKKTLSLDDVLYAGSVAAGILLFLSIAVYGLSRVDASTGDKSAKLALSMAASVLLLAIALKKIAKLDMRWDQALIAVLSIGILLLAMAESLAEVGRSELDDKAIKATGTAMIKIAISVLALSVALKKLSTIEIGQLWSSFGVLFLLLAETTAALVILGKQENEDKESDNLKKSATAIKKVASALLILSASLILLSFIDGTKLWERFGILALGLAEITAALFILGKWGGDVTASAQAIKSVSTALLLMAAAIALLAIIPMEALGKGFIAFAAILVFATASLLILSKVAPAAQIAAKAMLTLSIAVLVFEAGLLALSLILRTFNEETVQGAQYLAETFATIFQGIADNVPIILGIIESLIIGILDIIARSGIHLVEAAVAVGKSILLAIRELVPDLIETVIVLVQALLDALVVLSGPMADTLAVIILNILTWLQTYIGPMIEALMALVIGLINGLADAIRNHAGDIWNAVLNLIEALGELVISLFEEVLSWIPGWGPKIAEKMEGWKEAMRNALPVSEAEEMGNSIGEAVAEGIGSQDANVAGAIDNLTTGSIEGVTDDASKAAEDAGEEAGNSFLEGLTGNSLIGSSGDSLLSGLTSSFNSVDLQSLGQDGFQGLMNGFASDDNIAIAEDASSGLGESVVTALKEEWKVGSPSKEFEDVGYWAVEGLADGFRHNKGVAFIACSEVTAKVQEPLNALKETFTTSGKNAIQGFINGMKSLKNKAKTTAQDIAATATDALNGELDENSPSKVFFKSGAFATEGFINGLSSANNKVRSAAAGMGASAISSIQSAISNINGILDLETDPVIKPVLDLSDVQSGIGNLDAMLSRRQAIGIAASSNSPGSNQNGQSNGPITINMTVNGAEGQNIKDLANEITTQINNKIKVRSRVWA